jgi:hypothetical protein
MPTVSERCPDCGERQWSGMPHTCPPYECAYCGAMYQRYACHRCPPLQAAIDQAAAARRYAADTHMGACPQCHSRNVVQRLIQTDPADHRAQVGACCVGAFIFWPLLLAAPFMSKPARREPYRQCAYCGHSWKV